MISTPSMLFAPVGIASMIVKIDLMLKGPVAFIDSGPGGTVIRTLISGSLPPCS